jgi:hypothetical protein
MCCQTPANLIGVRAPLPQRPDISGSHGGPGGVHLFLVGDVVAGNRRHVGRREYCLQRAFAELYPGAPTHGLVTTNIAEAWGKAD